MLKDVFTGAATAAASLPGPLQDFYNQLVARGLREEMARLTQHDCNRIATQLNTGLVSGSAIAPRRNAMRDDLIVALQS